MARKAEALSYFLGESIFELLGFGIELVGSPWSIVFPIDIHFPFFGLRSPVFQLPSPNLSLPINTLPLPHHRFF